MSTRRPLSAVKIRQLVARKRGVLLDISRSGTPQAQSLSLKDDLKHDPRRIPFPLPDACVHTAVVTHVLEYLDPERFFAWWDDLHRIMRPGGHVYVSGPYGGDESIGWLADPTHRIRMVESSFSFLDPRTPFYLRYEPKPWRPQSVTRVPGPHGSTGYNALLERV